METEKPKRQAHKRWDDAEEALLTEAYKTGESISDIADNHGRSEGAITARLQLLDLITYGNYNDLLEIKNLAEGEEPPKNQGEPWNADDETRLVNSHYEKPTSENIIKLAIELGRTPRSLVLKLVGLGVVEPKLNPNPNPKPKPIRKPKPKKIIEVTKPTRTMKVSITAEFQTGSKSIEAGENLLILGSAGTGKSTFLKWVRKNLEAENSNKNYVVLAPTGMAALQVGGQTIHSFFGFKPQLMDSSDAWRKPRNPKIYKNLDLIIIDEISMVRADVFDSIDKFLRKYGKNPSSPFGGVQILALGDLFQLSPIVRYDEKEYFQTMFGTPFFFGSDAWRGGNFHILEFTKIFRQSDEPFINLLTQIRYGEKSADLLDSLNQRLAKTAPQDAVILAARNRTVDNINQRELKQLQAETHTYTAHTTGKVDEKSFTSPAILTLKKGARVMFTRNDVKGRWVNGTLGEVINCGTASVTIKIEGEEYIVEPVKWELTKYTFDKEKNAPVATVAGTFSQLPLTLAWALTIHKAQGQTLENCVIDLSDGGTFAEGQLYVALSRARDLESIYLTQPITSADIRTSPDVKGFYKIINSEQ